MLAFALLILVALIISTAIIWLWRMISDLHGYARRSPANPANETRVRLKTQRGFISSTNHRTKGNSKAPWGW